MTEPDYDEWARETPEKRDRTERLRLLSDFTFRQREESTPMTTTDTPAARLTARMDRLLDTDALMVEKTELRALIAENERLTRELRVYRLRAASAENIAGLTPPHARDITAELFTNQDPT